MLKIKYRHSASKGNTFIDSPPFWIINNLYEFDSKPNARMKMGSTAEDAANHALLNKINDEDVINDYAKTQYVEKYKGNEEEVECAWSGIIANKFVQELPQFGKVMAYQNELQIPGKDYGLEYDIIGKTDFEFENVIIDTKATAYIRRLKAGHVDPKWYPKAADLRQQFLYKELFKKETMLLYCSPKDVYATDLDGRTGYLEDLINSFKTIEHILKIAKTKEDIVRMYPLTFDNFRWKGTPEAVDFAKDIWSKAFK